MGDFKTLSATVTLLFGALGIGSLYFLMDKVKEKADECKRALDALTHQRQFLEKLRAEMFSELTRWYVILLQLLCLLALSSLAALLIAGPDKLLEWLGHPEDARRTHLIAQLAAAQGLALPSAGAPGFPQVVVALRVASLDAPALPEDVKPLTKVELVIFSLLGLVLLVVYIRKVFALWIDGWKRYFALRKAIAELKRPPNSEQQHA